VPLALPVPRKFAIPRKQEKVFLLLFLQKKKDLYRPAISLTGIDLILRAAATPTLRAYRPAISLTGIKSHYRSTP
jgi:hypothetical protein